MLKRVLRRGWERRQQRGQERKDRHKAESARRAWHPDMTVRAGPLARRSRRLRPRTHLQLPGFQPKAHVRFARWLPHGPPRSGRCRVTRSALKTCQLARVRSTTSELPAAYVGYTRGRVLQVLAPPPLSEEAKTYGPGQRPAPRLEKLTAQDSAAHNAYNVILCPAHRFLGQIKVPLSPMALGCEGHKDEVTGDQLLIPLSFGS